MKPYKRNPENPDCPWSVRFNVAGRAYQFSCKTTDRTLAVLRGKEYRAALVAKRYGLADGMKAVSGGPTFADVFAVYNNLPTPEELTRTRNIAAMKAVLAANGMTENDRLDRLSSQLAMTYQARVKRERPNCNAAIVSANSTMRKSRSLFSKGSLLAYKATMTIPREAVDSYFEVPFLKEARPLKQMPSEEAMAKAVEALKDKPDHYRAYLMAAVAGCRAGEIVAARRSWLEGNILRIGAFPDEFKSKGGAERKVAIPPAVAAFLLSGDDMVYLAGSRRHQIVGRELNHILKTECGFKDPKPIHSLRRWFGSMIYSSQGAAAAKESLGHSSIQVSEAHYLHLMTQQKPIEFVV